MVDAQLVPPRPAFLPADFGTVGHRAFVEIIVEQPVSYAPKTVGWYLLALLVLGWAARQGLLALRRYRRDAYRRSALGELSALRAGLATDREASLAAVPGLLKRCALSVFPRDQVAALSGAAWLSFLEQRAPGALSEQAQLALMTLVTRSAGELPGASDVELLDGVERWMRSHRA